MRISGEYLMTERKTGDAGKIVVVIAIIGVLIVIAIVVAMLGFSRWTGPNMMSTGMMGRGMSLGWMWGSMFLIPILFVVLILLGVYYVAIGFKEGTQSTGKTGGKSLEILKERYAKGELNTEEFQKMKEQLQS